MSSITNFGKFVFRVCQFVRNPNSYFRICTDRNSSKLSTMTMATKRLVVISGCDSGLGLTMANWAFEAGFPVLAGLVNIQGEGAKFLASKTNSKNGNEIFLHSLDVTQSSSLDSFAEKCGSLVHQNFKLHALILNAAVAVPGEFFWLTTDQKKTQIQVNFWGSVNLTSTFQSLLLDHQSRVVVVSSDCADYSLPGLAIYCASKSALESWAMAFRLEVAKYGISVVSFQPGDFVSKSRLLTGQRENFETMTQEMHPKLSQFYGKTIHNFHSHYIRNFNEKSPLSIQPMEDVALERQFVSLLTKDVSLVPLVKVESWGQKMFHFLITHLPQFQSDSLILKVMNSPKWKSQNK